MGRAPFAFHLCLQIEITSVASALLRSEFTLLALRNVSKRQVLLQGVDRATEVLGYFCVT